MAKVYVRKPFPLTMPDGTVHQYEIGMQEMPDEHADHWFTKAHTIGEPTLADLRGAVARAQSAFDVAETALTKAKAALELAEAHEPPAEDPAPDSDVAALAAAGRKRKE
ncbi:MAG: hypothetical protein KGH75_02415 [Rhodospirillales bacterium]|nr:hypothetical protein [Rhodospirillales bacterium]